mmetsp:Transcript_6561/g.9535  ORF Transcript_6561/g.9535 Transcript_6561/m.9535 type:complete len:374 (+) Transcript_6561:114-1235(+)
MGIGDFNPFKIPDNIETFTLSDKIGIGIGLFIAIINILSSFIVFLKFKYGAVRTKHPMLLLAANLFNVLWFVGACFVNAALPITSSSFCIYAYFWMYMLGLLGWVLCVFTRMGILLLIYRFKIRKTRLPPSVIIVLILLLPILILFIPLTIFQSTFFYEHQHDQCYINLYGTIVEVSLALPLLIIGSVLVLLNCRIRRELLKTKIEIVGLALLLIEFLLIIFAWCFRLNQLSVIRTLHIFQSILCSTYYFWAISYKNIYYIVTCNHFYFERWNQHFDDRSRAIFEQQNSNYIPMDDDQVDYQKMKDNDMPKAKTLKRPVNAAFAKPTQKITYTDATPRTPTPGSLDSDIADNDSGDEEEDNFGINDYESEEEN